MMNGCLFSPDDIRDYKVGAKILKAESLPTEYTLPLTSFTVKNQGNVSSCVAHALSSMLEKIYTDNFSTRMDLWL